MTGLCSIISKYDNSVFHGWSIFLKIITFFWFTAFDGAGKLNRFSHSHNSAVEGGGMAAMDWGQQLGIYFFLFYLFLLADT